MSNMGLNNFIILVTNLFKEGTTNQTSLEHISSCLKGSMKYRQFGLVFRKRSIGACMFERFEC